MTMQELNEIIKNRDFELLKNVKNHGKKGGTIWNRDFLINDDLIEYKGFVYQVNATWGILDKKEIKHEGNARDYVDEIIQQKKELGIECPPVEPDKVTIISED